MDGMSHAGIGFASPREVAEAVELGRDGRFEWDGIPQATAAATVVEHHLGWTMVSGSVRCGRRDVAHAWNELPDGRLFDSCADIHGRIPGIVAADGAYAPAPSASCGIRMGP